MNDSAECDRLCKLIQEINEWARCIPAPVTLSWTEVLFLRRWRTEADAELTNVADRHDRQRATGGP